MFLVKSPDMVLNHQLWQLCAELTKNLFKKKYVNLKTTKRTRITIIFV